MDGEEGLGLGDGTGVFQDLADLDELAEQLAQSYGGRPDGRRRPRQAGPPARRPGRGRRAHPAASSSRRCATAATMRARLRRPAPADPEGDAPARQGAAARRRRPDVRPPGPARHPAGRRGGGALRGHPASGSSATPSRGTSPAPSPTRVAARPAPRRRPAAGRRAARARRHRGPGDRGPHPGLRGAAGRHVVLDGHGRSLGADEAHRAGAAHADHAPASAATTCS